MFHVNLHTTLQTIRRLGAFLNLVEKFLFSNKEFVPNKQLLSNAFFVTKFELNEHSLDRQTT